jgi:hypothetical protein
MIDDEAAHRLGKALDPLHAFAAGFSAGRKRANGGRSELDVGHAGACPREGERRNRALSEYRSYLWKGQHFPQLLRWRTTDLSLLLGWTDEQLLEGYKQTDGTPGDREANLLLKEIKRRNLDI